MKYLIMCEGPNELAIMNILLDNNRLKITRDDLIVAIKEYKRIANHKQGEYFLADLLLP